MTKGQLKDDRASEKEMYALSCCLAKFQSCIGFSEVVVKLIIVV